MSHHDDPVATHRKHGPAKVPCGVVTISDTRSLADDRSGAAIVAALEAAGHDVVARALVKDDPGAIRLAVEAAAQTARAVVTTGGTGLTARDSTFEVLSDLIQRPIPGFGELFRALSFEEIGSAAMLSRAVAGVLPGGAVVFALPGSSKAVELGMTRLIVPELGHVLEQLDR